MNSADKYVAGAYFVVLVALLLYVAIISLKLQRFEREVDELTELARVRARESEDVRVG